MSNIGTVIAAGGVVLKNEKILLVKTTYGHNKGLWMLPGGIIEPGESIENGAIREVMEETNIEAMITGIRAVRTGVRVCEKCDQTNLYIAFNMDYISGNEKADGCETSAVRFFSMSEVNELEQIVGLSKAIILNSHDSSGLNLNNTGFVVNNSYKSYSLYV